MPSAHDDCDHKETRLLLAAAVALILLVAIVWDLLLRRIREFLGPVRGRAGSQERGADFFRRLSRRDLPSCRAATPSSASCRSPSQGF